MDFAKILTIAIIALFGAMSPGPDFAIVTKNCLSGNFRNGILSALGVGCALMIHLTYCVLGIALIIAESPTLFYTLKYIGAGYLFYLGIILLKDKTGPEGPSNKAQIQKGRKAFISGFLCNLLNPKCTLFMLSLFTQFIDPRMSLFEKAIFAGVIFFVSLGWFIFLSFLITHRLFQKHFARFQLAISKVMGVMLCMLAFYVAFSRD